MMNDIKSFSELERVWSADKAISIGFQAIRGLGFTANLSIFGDIVQTTRCELYSGLDKIAEGLGKGINRQSQASSLFEAIEHYVYYEQAKSLPAEQVILGPGRLSSVFSIFSPDLSLFRTEAPIQISCDVMDELGGVRTMLVPRFLLYPSFSGLDETECLFLSNSRISRYASNSGVASGTNPSEALLHGLLEIIERDAIGLEVLATVFSKSPRKARLIDISTISNDIIADILQYWRSHGNELSIQIFNITTEFGIPTLLASLTDHRTGHVYFGSGSSLFRDIALIRAITEAVQGIHTYTHIKKCESRDPPTDLHGTRFIDALMEFGIYRPRGGTTTQSFEQVPDWTLRLGYEISPDRQLAILVNWLRKFGYTFFKRELSKGLVSVCHVFSPDLERFFLVTSGIPVVPGQRGREMLARCSWI